jgi:hypothetical protein
MTIEELQQKLDRLPRFPGGSSFVIINGATDPDGIQIFIANANPEDCEPHEEIGLSPEELEALLDSRIAAPATDH